MKLRFTKSITRSFLSFCLISTVGIGVLHAQNSANNSVNGTNSAQYGQLAATSSNNYIKVVLDPDNMGGNVLSGKVVLSDSLHSIKDVFDVALAIDFDPATVDPQSLQFDLSQDNVGELYKLLNLYKSEAGKGHTVITLSRKNQPGKVVDTIFIVFKYVVADDLLGYTPAVATVEPPVVAGSKFYGQANSNASPQVSGTVLAGMVLTYHNNVPDVINLYPNPAQNYINVDLNMLSGSVVRVYNIQGKLVKTVPSLPNVGLHKIDIADLPSGFYILGIDTPNGQVEKKFSKIN